MDVTEADLKELRDELDKLYKNFAVITGRASRRIEHLRTAANFASTDESPTTSRFRSVYKEMHNAALCKISYTEHLVKALQTLDPRWSKTWANHAALLVLEPDRYHSPPVLSPRERDDPPSNMF